MQYDELIQAIVKAVPEIKNTWQHNEFGKPPWIRPITLEDVLQSIDAIRVGEWWNVCTDGAICLGFKNRGQWHLGHDLSWHREHAPETVAWLHSLLCK